VSLFLNIQTAKGLQEKTTAVFIATILIGFKIIQDILIHFTQLKNNLLKREIKPKNSFLYNLLEFGSELKLVAQRNKSTLIKISGLATIIIGAYYLGSVKAFFESSIHSEFLPIIEKHPTCLKQSFTKAPFESSIFGEFLPIAEKYPTCLKQNFVKAHFECSKNFIEFLKIEIFNLESAYDSGLSRSYEIDDYLVSLVHSIFKNTNSINSEIIRLFLKIRSLTQYKNTIKYKINNFVNNKIDSINCVNSEIFETLSTIKSLHDSELIESFLIKKSLTNLTYKIVKNSTNINSKIIEIFSKIRDLMGDLDFNTDLDYFVEEIFKNANSINSKNIKSFLKIKSLYDSGLIEHIKADLITDLANRIIGDSKSLDSALVNKLSKLKSFCTENNKYSIDEPLIKLTKKIIYKIDISNENLINDLSKIKNLLGFKEYIDTSLHEFIESKAREAFKLDDSDQLKQLEQFRVLFTNPNHFDAILRSEKFKNAFY
jgi:hypothetical protein